MHVHDASLLRKAEEDRQKLMSIAKRCPVAKTLSAEIKIDEVLVD